MKTPLSTIVYDLVNRGSIDHAIVLVEAAKNGKITTREIVKICQIIGKKSTRGVTSWISQTIHRGWLKRIDRATYTLGDSIINDLNEALKVLERYGINLAEIEKILKSENKRINIGEILQQYEKYREKIIQLEEEKKKLHEQYENLLQELERLRKENEELRREVEKLRSGVGGEDFEKLRREVEVLRKEKEQMLKELEELEEKSIELRKKLEQYRTIMKKLKSGIKILLEKAKTLKYYMIVKVENETLFLPIIDEEKWREILEKVGTIQDVTFTREGKREIKKGIIRAACVCYDKQQ